MATPWTRRLGRRAARVGTRRRRADPHRHVARPFRACRASHRAANLTRGFPVSPVVMLSVVKWELRRIVAGPSNFGVAAGVFALFVGLVWVKHSWLIPVESGPGRGVVL